MINLIFDSTFFYQHLFSENQSVLALFTSLSREGRVTLFIPWVVHQEVISNIPSWSLEHIGMEKIPDFNARSLAAGIADSKARDATDAAKSALVRFSSHISSRYHNWLNASDCTIVPLRLEDAAASWEAYFKGAPPFPAPKMREHLPDAHIFHSVATLSSAPGHWFFLTSDKNLRDAVATISGVMAPKAIYSVFEELGLSEHFREFVKTCPVVNALPLTEASMREAIRLGVRGKYIGEESVSACTIKQLRIAQQATIPLGRSTALVGFEADVSLDVKITNVEGLSKTILRRKLTATVEGHVVVDLDKSSGELDDLTFRDVAEISPVEVVILETDPSVEVGWLHRQRMTRVLAQARGGVVAVIGGTDLERKKIAEAIAIKRLTFHDGSHVALRTFDLREPDARVLPTAHPDLTPLLFFEQPDVVCLDASSDQQLAKVFEAAWTELDVLFVVVMKAVRSGEQVVREINRIDPASGNLRSLLAYANVTGREDGKTIFNFNDGCDWGSGAWDVVLQRDEMFGRRRH